MNNIEKELAHFKQSLYYIEKGSGKKVCKEFNPDCPNCKYQLLRGFLIWHIDLLRWEIMESKVKKKRKRE